MTTRRNALNEISIVQQIDKAYSNGQGHTLGRLRINAGVWLDKFIRDQDDDGGSRNNLVHQVAQTQLPEIYSNWFEQWRKALGDCGAQVQEAHVQGRMAIGLGQESVLETSLTLHHTYGVPFIPGSALKGLVASFTRQHLSDEWQPNNGAYEILFGDIESSGYVTFYDAMPLPGNFEILTDVITVHHPEYYQTGTSEPADWDNPTPIPFLSAKGTYLVALSGPEDWVDAAFEILASALNYMGIGAKTSSGYGRLNLTIPVEPIDPVEQHVSQLIEEIQVMRTQEVAGGIHAYYEQWTQIEGPSKHKRDLAKAIVAKVKDSGREKRSKKKKWYQELLEVIK